MRVSPAWKKQTWFREFLPRMRGLLVALVLLPVLLRADSHREVVFSAMGCGPYTVKAEEALAWYIYREGRDRSSEFLVHCGDILTGKNPDWPESEYAKVARILRTDNSTPTFVLPGDNEWNDQADPDRHWGYWTKYFQGFERYWSFRGAVDRQKERPENFVFILDGVVFIGVNKVGGRVHDAAEWKKRHRENAQWIASQFVSYREVTRAAVVFAQASAEGNDKEFVTSFAASAKRYGHPVLYLHADGHKWFVNEKQWAPNITHVQLDVVNEAFPPVQVRVTLNPKKPFHFDRRLGNPFWRYREPKPAGQ